MKKEGKNLSGEMINNPNRAYYRQFEQSLKNLHLNEFDDKGLANNRSNQEEIMYISSALLSK